MCIINKIFFLIVLYSFSLTSHANNSDEEKELKSYAKTLGYNSTKQLREEYKEFSKRVKAGFAPNGYFDLCRKNFKQSLCDVLNEHLTPPPKTKSSKKMRARSVPFRIKNIKKLNKLSFRELTRKIPDFSKNTLHKWSKAALKNKDCPLNINNVLASELEEKKPNAADWKLIDSLWESGLSCYNPDSESNEYVFLRAALSQIARANYKKALIYLNSALASTKQIENYRSNYWKYVTLKKLNEKSAAKEIIELFRDEYPVSWFWINIAHQEGIDPLKNISSKDSIKDVYEAKDKITNQYFYWTKVASILEEYPNDLRIFFEKTAQKLIEENNIGLSQNAAKTFNKMKLYRFQIYVLSKVILNKPKQFNKEHLDLLYPRPFFEEMKQHSGLIDTAVLLGLARQESGFDVYARSSANARGLLQILPSTAKGLNRKIKRDELYDYNKNIKLGAKFMTKLLTRFDSTLEYSLGAYNAGATHMRRWRERFSWAEKDLHLFIALVPFKETRDYIPSVLRNAFWYHKLFPSLDDFKNNETTSGKLLEPLLQKAQAKD